MNAYEYPVLQGQIAQLQEVNRQQADRIAELEKQVKHWTTPCQPLCKPSVCDCITPPTTCQLTNEEIYEIWKKAMQEEAKVEYSIYATQLERQPFIYFARAIEAKLKGQL
jgi:hypothetical protein